MGSFVYMWVRLKMKCMMGELEKRKGWKVDEDRDGDVVL
jgi:hypothetical protein